MDILELLAKADAELAAVEAEEAKDAKPRPQLGGGEIPGRAHHPNEGRAAILYLAVVARSFASIARSKALR